ncbi:AQUAPORIN SIP1-1 [Salix purpurea]|uniref:AQUAPORIN SIP1-1 n=1 Tax=Salix purpurea TaxID=77065 RepID=A0A9Q0PES0_SALPP|nr:AQUAPORIN SIP1-1 [Salix purpurea]
MGAIKGAIVDGILTAMWVFSVPLLGVFSSITATYVGVEPMSIAALFITINVAALFMLTFSLIGAALGGASFNPATTITLYMAGLKPDASLMSMALSFPAQAAGGVGGAMVIRGVMPNHHRHVLKGGPLLEGGPAYRGNCRGGADFSDLSYLTFSSAQGSQKSCVEGVAASCGHCGIGYGWR